MLGFSTVAELTKMNDVAFLEKEKRKNKRILARVDFSFYCISLL